MSTDTDKQTVASPLPQEGRRRAVIERVEPEIDGGRFPIRRVPGETVTVRADIFADGHDGVTALLRYRRAGEDGWRELPMKPIGNDRWEASFAVEELGSYVYTLSGRIDRFGTWRKDLEKRVAAGNASRTDILVGAEIVRGAAGQEDELLPEMAAGLERFEDGALALAWVDAEGLARIMDRYPDPALETRYGKELEVVVERREALFSAWYELFPRSCCTADGAHGTFRECERLLPRIVAMGFDVVYFPPIHPIGRTNRKGRNNATVAAGEDPGSPWAIGSAEGGHKAVHPELGTLADFGRFVARAKKLGLQVAMDIAFQCSPDHPHVKVHPEWFRWRPDGTVQYAENPPKRYEDIIPFDFENENWRQLWEELLGVFLFWIERGVTIFRVDNPHTKPFPFWEWVIREVRGAHPETIFLSEAFTRPKVMYRLAKLGFSQSYTYFSWRNTKAELEQYMTELTTTELREYFRPNFWPNTPDILPEFLQYGGNTAFVIRFLLAATLSSSYGVYGPPYDMFVADALPGREEYLDSEKFQIRCWDWNDPDNMRELITRVNRIRRENPALHSPWNIRFCRTDNDEIIAFVKRSDDLSNLLLVMISLDPFHGQAGSVELPLDGLGISAGHPFLAHDLLSGERDIWHNERSRVEFAASGIPARIWRLHPRLRRENDFDYYM